MGTGFWILFAVMMSGAVAWQMSYMICERWLVSTVGYRAPSGVAKFFFGKLWFAPGVFNTYRQARAARQESTAAAVVGWVGLGSSVLGLLAFFAFLATI